MNQPRYRTLVEYFFVHINIIRENESRIPVLSERLFNLRHILGSLQSEEACLQPLIQQLNETDLQELNELNIVAKHRYLDYIKKRDHILNEQHREQKNRDRKQAEFEQKMELMKPIIERRDERMKEFYRESSKRVFYS